MMNKKLIIGAIIAFAGGVAFDAITKRKKEEEVEAEDESEC